MGAIVADASSVVDSFRGDAAVNALLNESRPVYLPVVVEAELWYGALKSTLVDAEKQRVETLLARCRIVEANSVIARRAAVVRYELKLQGRGIPQDDLFVAATALVLDLPLLARDAHFEGISGLRLINP